MGLFLFLKINVIHHNILQVDPYIMHYIPLLLSEIFFNSIIYFKGKGVINEF